MKHFFCVFKFYIFGKQVVSFAGFFLKWPLSANHTYKSLNSKTSLNKKKKKHYILEMKQQISETKTQ